MKLKSIFSVQILIYFILALILSFSSDSSLFFIALILFFFSMLLFFLTPIEVLFNIDIDVMWIYILLLIFAGFFMFLGKKNDKTIKGILLFIIGFWVWIFIGFSLMERCELPPNEIYSTNIAEELNRK